MSQIRSGLIHSPLARNRTLLCSYLNVWSKAAQQKSPSLSGLKSKLHTGCEDSVLFESSSTLPTTPKSWLSWSCCTRIGTLSAIYLLVNKKIHVWINTWVLIQYTLEPLATEDVENHCFEDQSWRGALTIILRRCFSHLSVIKWIQIHLHEFLEADSLQDTRWIFQFVAHYHVQLMPNLSVQILHRESAQEKMGTKCWDAVLTSRACFYLPSYLPSS